MGKTRDLFKKIRDTEGTFHAKMGTINYRNGMDLTEQKILIKGGKKTQKNYMKKIPQQCTADRDKSDISNKTCWINSISNGNKLL